MPKRFVHREDKDGNFVLHGFKNEYKCPKCGGKCEFLGEPDYDQGCLTVNTECTQCHALPQQIYKCIDPVSRSKRQERRAMKQKHMLQKGNLKLSKEVGIFNLPAGSTCPGRTEYCSKVCYAKKAERVYPQVLPFRRAMLAATKGPNFVGEMAAEIKARGFKQVRIHESGCFYSEEYLVKWFVIAELCPETRFLAYTKNFGLDYSNRPKNLALLASIDSTTPDLLRRKGWRIPSGMPTARTIEPEEAVPTKAFLCPPVNSKAGHVHYCGKGCQECWKNVRNICFRVH